MFFIDDILLSPAKAFMWIVRELHNAAQQEIKGEEDRLTHKLSTLYMLLETGGVDTDEFDRQEREILERLDAIRAANEPQEGDDAPGDESDDEEDQDSEDDGEDDEESGDSDADASEDDDQADADDADATDETDQDEADDDQANQTESTRGPSRDDQEDQP